MSNKPRHPELPESVLQDLYHWLAAQINLDLKLSKKQILTLNQFCAQIHQDYQPVVMDFDYPGDSILKSRPGLDLHELHSGMLLMGKDSGTPIHDHANCFSVSLVLQGTVTFTFYRETGNDDHQNGICKVEKERSERLHARQFSYLPARTKLLHRLSTEGTPACMLDMLFPADPEAVKYWYLPLTSQEENPLYCCKISEREFSTITMGIIT